MHKVNFMLLLAFASIISFTNCSDAGLGERNTAVVSSPSCSGNYTSLRIWSWDGSQMCFSGNGFVNLNAFCKGPWFWGCQTWAKQVWGFDARDQEGYFVAAYWDPNTGAPLGLQYQTFHSGETQVWPTTIVSQSYGINITYNPLIQ